VSISKMEVKGFRVAFIDGKVRVKKYNSQRCFFSWVQGWQFVSSCRMIHWGSCQLTYRIYNTRGLPMGPYRGESNGDRDVWIQVEHEGTCLRCTEGKSYKGTIPLMQQVHRFGTIEEFEIHDQKSHVYRWKKALYGLKQNTPGIVWED